jgi:hypothetical protein
MMQVRASTARRSPMAATTGNIASPMRPSSAMDPTKPKFHSQRYVISTPPQTPQSQRYHQSLSGVHAPDLGLAGVSRPRSADVCPA